MSDKELSLENLMQQFKWHWTLVKVSEGIPQAFWDRWVIYDENDEAIGDDAVLKKALEQAIYHPLNETQRKYSPQLTQPPEEEK